MTQSTQQFNLFHRTIQKLATWMISIFYRRIEIRGRNDKLLQSLITQRQQLAAQLSRAVRTL